MMMRIVSLVGIVLLAMSLSSQGMDKNPDSDMMSLMSNQVMNGDYFKASNYSISGAVLEKTPLQNSSGLTPPREQKVLQSQCMTLTHQRVVDGGIG